MLSLWVFHTTTQHIWHCMLHIELVAKFSVDSPVCIVNRRHPYSSKVIELLQSNCSHPLFETIRMNQVVFYPCFCFLVVKNILVLCVSNVSQNVLGIVGWAMYGYQFIQTKLFNKVLGLNLNLFHLDFMLIVKLLRFWIVYCAGVSFNHLFTLVVMWKHRSRYRDCLIDRTSTK